MPRLKLQRFRAAEPPADVLARYVRVYASEALYRREEALPPLAAPALFGREGRLTLDLGSGRGEFLIEQARQQPDRLFVGIEIHWKSVWDAANRAAAADLDNVRFVRADLRRVLVKVPNQTIEEAWVLFPPPALEKKRLKNDLLSAPMLEHLGRMLADRAALRFVTDHPDYFAQKVAALRASGCFEELTLARKFEGGITRFQQFWESRDVASLRYEAVRVARGNESPSS